MESVDNNNDNNNNKMVDLICVEDHSKLRVRIITEGYLKNANCQFPRNIRQKDYLYRVRPSDITLITQHNRHYFLFYLNKEIFWC
jgi:hypothetical protein